jgi:hypothetical protein
MVSLFLPGIDKQYNFRSLYEAVRQLPTTRYFFKQLFLLITELDIWTGTNDILAR